MSKRKRARYRANVASRKHSKRKQEKEARLARVVGAWITRHYNIQHGRVIDNEGRSVNETYFLVPGHGWFRWYYSSPEKILEASVPIAVRNKLLSVPNKKKAAFTVRSVYSGDTQNVDLIHPATVMRKLA